MQSEKEKRQRKKRGERERAPIRNGQESVALEAIHTDHLSHIHIIIYDMRNTPTHTRAKSQVSHHVKNAFDMFTRDPSFKWKKKTHHNHKQKHILGIHK